MFFTDTVQLVLSVIVSVVPSTWMVTEVPENEATVDPIAVKAPAESSLEKATVPTLADD